MIHDEHRKFSIEYKKFYYDLHGKISKLCFTFLVVVFKVDGNGAAIVAPNLEFTQRNNTKRLRFSLNGSFNDLKLSNKAKLVIESVTLPNIINMSYRQSKCVGNILLRLHGLNRANSWDSSSQKKAAPTIFTTPVKLNLQGFGSQTD